jgi:hypothetical protein
VPEPGETFEQDGIRLRILEVHPYFTAMGRRAFLIACQIIDGKLITPTFHFWMTATDDINRKVKDVIDNYKAMTKKFMTG